MQLKLRVGVGDTLTIDVQAGDTFQDLSDKLFQLSGVRVDLSQLKSDKPVDMSTNVIQYFTPKIEAERQKLVKLCRLCSRAITHNPHYIFDKQNSTADKINSCLPVYVTTGDRLPKQICTICFKGLNSNYDFMKKVMSAQKTLENVFSVKHNRNCRTGECCPLCVIGKLRKVETKNGGVAGAALRKDSVSEGEEAPVRMFGVEPASSNIIEDTDTSRKEYYLEDEVVTGYWEGGPGGAGPSPRFDVINPGAGVGGRRYRKRARPEEDDSEWTIDEEYLPVSRRGRPKGVKTKKVMMMSSGGSMSVEKSCVMCGYLGPDSEMLNHSLTQHCQPDMAYFPCPHCKANQSTQLLLENHLSTQACSS